MGLQITDDPATAVEKKGAGSRVFLTWTVNSDGDLIDPAIYHFTELRPLTQYTGQSQIAESSLFWRLFASLGLIFAGCG